MPVTRSFENVEYWLDEVEKYAGPNVVKVRLLRKEAIVYAPLRKLTILDCNLFVGCFAAECSCWWATKVI